ncbi:hypothetical protein BC831DRAFT_435201 [Entophlyctis helioformis]|nr:hypothetical protein BC831DRAFT_435201 [Entophlyctis helioformis]
MILGIGVDVLRTSRMAALLQRTAPLRFVRRILNAREVADMLSQDFVLAAAGQLEAHRGSQWQQGQQGQQWEQAGSAWERKLVEYIGTRWAIKEAAFKALFGHARLEWHQVTVVKHAGRQAGRLTSCSLHRRLAGKPALLLDASILPGSPGAPTAAAAPTAASPAEAPPAEARSPRTPRPALQPGQTLHQFGSGGGLASRQHAERDERAWIDAVSGHVSVSHDAGIIVANVVFERH